MLGKILTTIGIIFGATPLWFVPLMQLLFRFGIGYHHRGKLRGVKLMDWLNATGIGMFFFAPIFCGLGQALQQH